MATYENDVILRTQDEDGNEHLNYPITHGDNVLIPDDLAEQLALAAENDPTVNLALSALITALNNKAAKTDIPTSLRANGGNADTVGGLAPTKFMQGLGVITSGDIKEIALALTHAGGFGAIGTNVTSMPTDGANWFVSIERGSTSHTRIIATRVTTNVTYVMTYNSGTAAWTDWTPIAFMGLGTVSSGSIKDYALGCTSTGGTAYIHNTVTDMPTDNSYWIAYITGGGVYHRCITAIQVTTGKTYYMVYNSSAKTWTGWVSTADGGNAATVSGVSVVTDNSLGLHKIASGSAEADDTNCPAGGWYGHHV